MKKKIISAWIVLFLAQSCFIEAQETDLKDYDTETGLSVASWKKYSEDSPYYFLEEKKEVVLNEDWLVDETVHYRIKIQKDSARDLGDQKIYYNQSREEILEIQAHVETSDGTQHPYTKIQDLDVFQDAPMYSDLKMKVVTLPQVNVGSIIDMKITSKMRHQIIRNQFARQEIYPTESHRYYQAKYILPKKMNIRFEERSPSVKAVRQDDGENEIYIFEHKRTMQEAEQLLPPYNEIYGISSFSSMPGWDTIADWYRGLVKKNTIPDDAIVQKARELTAEATTEREKARAILEFLQDKFRYVSMSFGDNAVEPHPTDEIFKNRYGDCKDWSILAKQMLNLAGIKANIVIFQDEYAGDPRWSLPAIDLFDHVILEIFIGDEKYFVDPQLKHFDFGQYPANYNNAYLFVIEDQGYRFETIPIEEEKTSLTKIKVVVSLDDSGGASYKVQALLGAELSNMMRMLWDTLGSDGKDMFFEGLETKFGRGGKIIDRSLDGIEKRYGPVKMMMKIKNARSYQKTADLIIIHEPVRQYFPNPFVDKHRRYPVFISSNECFKINFIYEIPPGWTVEPLPENVVSFNQLLELKRMMQLKDGKLHVLYVFRMRRGRWPSERYTELQDVFRRYDAKSSESIVLRRKDAGK